MKAIYWISTGLLSGFLLLSAFTYLLHKPTIEGVKELGFPDFFRIELAVLKTVAAVVLLLPAVPVMIKEWAYSGVALFLLTAVIAHLAHRDGPLILGVLLVLFAILITSYLYWPK
jgi:hypothetical protein